MQNTTISNNQSQIISVSDTDGDVNIVGNVITQNARVNMVALLDSLNNNDIQQKIAQQLDQLAKSIVQGLNFLTFSDAKSVVDSLIKSQVDINNIIKQSCAVSSVNQQTITIQYTKGTVNIINNTLSQVTDIFTDCALKSVANNKVISDIQNRISQTSSAELKGFNLAWVIALVALFILVPLFTAGRIVNSGLKFIFPLMILLGIVFFTLYFVTGKTIMKTFYFTKSPSSDSGCTLDKDNSIDSKTLNTQEAISVCEKSSSCKFVDVRLTDKGATVLPTPQINYYTNGENCGLKFWEQDASKIPATDTTALKVKERYQWMLFVGIGLAIGGILGFFLQRRNQSTTQSTSSSTESIEMSTL